MTNQLIKPFGWAKNEKVTSPQLNQLQQYVANSVDKTGETSGTGGGITGVIEWLSGSSILFDSGSYINGNMAWLASLSAPTLLQLAPGSDVQAGSLTIQSADAWSSATVHPNGGTLVIGTGNGSSSGTFGNLNINIGHGITALPCLEAGSNITNLYGANDLFLTVGTTTAIMQASATVTELFGAGNFGIGIHSGYVNMNMPILFNDSTGAPQIGYLQQTGNVAATALSIQAQAASSTASGANKNGAPLILADGPPTSPGIPNGVWLVSGGVSGTICEVARNDAVSMFPTNEATASPGTSPQSALTVFPIVGSFDLQAGINQLIPIVVNTSNATPTSALSFGLNANQTFTATITYVYRDTTLVSTSSGSAIYTATGYCDGSGNAHASAISSLTVTTIGAAIGGLSMTVAGPIVTINVIGASSTNLDWQMQIALMVV